jgi:hypothetical protein
VFSSWRYAVQNNRIIRTWLCSRELRTLQLFSILLAVPCRGAHMRSACPNYFAPHSPPNAQIIIKEPRARPYLGFNSCVCVCTRNTMRACRRRYLLSPIIVYTSLSLSGTLLPFKIFSGAAAMISRYLAGKSDWFDD